MKRQNDYYLSLFRFLTVWSWALLIFGGFLFLLRRTMGGFAPQDWQLPVLGFMGCLLSIAAYPAVRFLFSHSFSSLIRLGVLAWAASLLYLGAMCTSQNAALSFLVLLVFSIVHAAVWFWSWDLKLPKEEISKPIEAIKNDNIKEESEPLEENEEEALDFPDETLAHWTRQTVPATPEEPQREVLSGWVRVRFAPRQQTETINIPFVPPFAKSPETNCYALQGADVKLDVAQNSPHGARLELKLSRPLDAVHDIIIEITAQGEPIRFS